MAEPCPCQIARAAERLGKKLCDAGFQADTAPIPFICMLPNGHGGDHRACAITHPAVEWKDGDSEIRLPAVNRTLAGRQVRIRFTGGQPN